MDLNKTVNNMIKQHIENNATLQIKRLRMIEQKAAKSAAARVKHHRTVKKQRQQPNDDWAKFVAFKDRSRACMQRAIEPIKHQVIEAKLDTDLLIFKGLSAPGLDKIDRADSLIVGAQL